MSGFDTSRNSSGNIFRSKQFGSILRGYGPPVPQAGVGGDLYIDVLSFNLFERRAEDSVDDWGHFLFNVPGLYRTALKWFGAAGPDNSIGVPGDYFLQWAGFPNYGMNPIIWGPKLWTGWPENGDGPPTTIASTMVNVAQIGLVDEGPDLVDMQLNQLLAVGLFDEYVIPVPVTANPGDPVLAIGLQSTGALVVLTINTMYTPVDQHSI